MRVVGQQSQEAARAHVVGASRRRTSVCTGCAMKWVDHGVQPDHKDPGRQRLQSKLAGVNGAILRVKASERYIAWRLQCRRTDTTLQMVSHMRMDRTTSATLAHGRPVSQPQAMATGVCRLFRPTENHARAVASKQNATSTTASGRQPVAWPTRPCNRAIPCCAKTALAPTSCIAACCFKFPTGWDE